MLLAEQALGQQLSNVYGQPKSGHTSLIAVGRMTPLYTCMFNKAEHACVFNQGRGVSCCQTPYLQGEQKDWGARTQHAPNIPKSALAVPTFFLNVLKGKQLRKK